jgi:uncharacterized membrane protein
MTMRIQELHPALVHYPIALLPVALAADAAGRLTGDRTLLAVGKQGMKLAAASAMVAAAAGVLAQEAGRYDRTKHELLVTHRNLNLGLVALTAVMAVRRSRRRHPSLGYLAAGLAGLGTMAYSAYLGGHMVYEHGLGVSAAGGLREEEAPELTPGNARDVLATSGRHMERGLRRAAADLARGEVAPWLTGSGRPEPVPEPVPVERI